MTASVFHHTRSFCCDCQELHGAALVEQAGAVYLEVDCPREKRRVRLTDDARTFRAIRQKSVLPEPPVDAARGFSWINFLEITRDCNCRCPVCYADAGPEGGGYLAVAEVEAICRRLKQQGVKAVSLTGGEPTLHPELLPIIAAVRRVGLDVTLISNGLLLGQDPALARRLRRSGIAWLYLQLDTLRPEVCQRIRGDRRVDERDRALQHAREGGLLFGVNTTVVRDNLDELPALLRHATRYAPHLSLVTLLAAGRTGRFQLEPEACVTREQIMTTLVGSGAVDGLTTDHFWPFPRFAPLGLDVHPDCGVVLPLALDRGRLRPLEDYLDVGRVFRGLAAARGPVDRKRAGALLVWHLLRAVRPGRALALARMLRGLLTRRGDSSFVTVVIEQFAHPEHQDEERIQRCTTCCVLRDGQRVPLCVFQHADPRRAEQTRVATSAERRGTP